METPAPDRRTRRGRWKVRILLAGLGLVLSLASAEAVLAGSGLVAPIVPTYPGEARSRASKTFREDPGLGWTMRPGESFEWETEGRPVTYRASEQGFRVPEEGAREERPHTIALVGDSFVWGLGVTWEESVAGRLEAALPSARVLNFGMPGFGLDQIALALEQHALPAGPVLVIAGVYPVDLDRSHHAFRRIEGFAKPCFLLEDGELRPRTPEDTPSAWRRSLRSHSRLLAVLHRFERWRGRRWASGDWWALNAALLDRMCDRAAAADVPLLFVHVPQESWAPCPALGLHLGARGAPFVDLFARPVGDPARLYFPTDGHLTPEGHALFAEAVLEWIRGAGLDLD